MGPIPIGSHKTPLFKPTYARVTTQKKKEFISTAAQATDHTRTGLIWLKIKERRAFKPLEHLIGYKVSGNSCIVQELLDYQ